MRATIVLACCTALGPTAAQTTPSVEVGLTARLLDAAGAPIAGAGAAVGLADQLLTDDALRRPSARSDRDGRLRLTVAVGDGEPGVLFAAAGKRAVWRRAGRQPTADLGDVYLLDGTLLAGRVHDAEGRPLADVRVRARDLLADGGLSIAITDARGQFQLPGCAPNCVELLFTKAGHHHRRLAPVGRTTPISVAMSRSGLIRGHVSDTDGRPWSGELQIQYEVQLDADDTIAVAADGSFATTLAHPTRYRLRGRDHVRSPVLHGPQDDLQLGATVDVPPPARTIEVRAVDHRSRLPVRALRATLTSTRSLLQSAVQPAWREADDEGRVVLPISPRRPLGDLRVMASAAGYATTTTMPVELDGEATPIVIALEPEASIEGRVVDGRSRKPIAGCSVWAVACPDRRDPRAVIGYSHLPADAVRTDVDGRFRIGCLGSGPHVVQAFTPEYCAPAAIEVTTNTGAVRDGVTVELDAAGELHGTLSDLAEPTSWEVVANGGMVFLSSENTGISFLAPQPQGRTAVARDGSFTVTGVQPHELKLRLETTAHTRFGPWLAFDLPEQRIVGRTEVAFAATDYRWGSVAGTLRLDGLPGDLDRFLVVAVPPGKPSPLQVMRRQHLATVVAADGRYALSLPCATYQLRVFDVTGHAEPFVVENAAVAAGTTELDLRPEWHAVDLTLEPRRAGSSVLVDHLRVERVGATTPTRPMALPGETAWRAVRLEPGQRRVRLLLRSGAHEVVAYSLSHQLDLGAASETRLAQRTIEVTGPGAFTVSVDAPPF